MGLGFWRIAPALFPKSIKFRFGISVVIGAINITRKTVLNFDLPIENSCVMFIKGDKKLKSFSPLVLFIIALFLVFSAANAEKAVSYKVKDQIKLRDHSLKGSELYHRYCSVCHGDKGNSVSRASKSLDPSPANFTDPEVIKRLDRKRMFEVIKNGSKGTAMVGWFIQLTDEEINRIISYIRYKFMKVEKSAAEDAGSNLEKKY